MTDTPEEVRACVSLAGELPSPRLLSALADEDDPTRWLMGEHVGELEMRAVEPVEVQRDIEVVEDAREFVSRHRPRFWQLRGC